MLGLMLFGCKPTEKNYQQAYDLAMRKHEDALASVGGGTLDAMDGAHKEAVGQDTIYVISGTFKTYEAPADASDKPGEAEAKPGKIGIVVAQYGMDTNARRHAADLRGRYPDAFVATDGRQKYYVVVERRSDLRDAVGAIKAFSTDNPTFRYIALPGPSAIYLID